MLFTYWIKNCQRRALIIEKLTESKEQFFFSLSLSLLFIVCCLHRLKATLRPVNTIISILKTSRAVFFFGERTRSTQRAAASSVTRAKMKVSPSCGTSPPMGCNKRRRERERERERGRGAASGEPPTAPTASSVCVSRAAGVLSSLWIIESASYRSATLSVRLTSLLQIRQRANKEVDAALLIVGRWTASLLHVVVYSTRSSFSCVMNSRHPAEFTVMRNIHKLFVWM